MAWKWGFIHPADYWSGRT